MRQLRLIVVGATIGAICGSVVLGPNHDLRPVGIAVAAGVIVLGLTYPVQRFASQPGPRLAPAYQSLIGRAIVTLAAALSVVFTFNMLVASDARSVPARPNAQSTVGQVPGAPPPQVAAPIAPASSAGLVAPVVPASPQPAVRPPAATQPTSHAPRATVAPVSSPAATSPVSPFATPRAATPSPPPSAPTAVPAQTVAPATLQPATPEPTPVSSPPSIIPTLPPLPTLPIGLP